jgi:hypothetical protein
MEKEKILLLVKILESNTKILNSYKKIINKVDILEENINRKFKDKDEENKFIKELVDSSNDFYYQISKNLL